MLAASPALRAKRMEMIAMTDSKMTSTNLDEMQAMIKRGESKTDLAKVRASMPYVWDGKNEFDRPLTREEFRAGISEYRRRNGQSSGK